MRLLIGLLVAACIATGCTTGTGDGAASEPSGDEPSGAKSALPNELAHVDQSFPLGERLRLALDRPATYLPERVVLSDQAAVIISDLLYDGLTEAVAGQSRLRPALATSWSTNEDFTVWLFELDPNSGVSAEVVVDALASFASGHRAGGPAAVTAGIRSVSSIGGQTVLIELLSSNAGLPWILSGLPYSVSGPGGAPTGDYRVVADDVNGLVMQRREVADNGGRRELPAEIDIRWLGEEDDAEGLVADGAVAAAAVDPAQVSQQDSGLETVTTSVATRFYVMNAGSAFLADADVRLAVLAAIDRPGLTRDGFDQRVTPVDGVVSPSLAGFQPDSCGSACRFDPERSAKLLIDAVGDLDSTSIPLRLSYTGGEEQDATASAILSQLSAAGFEAAVSPLAPNELARAIVAGETDLFAFGWVAPATSIDAVVPPLFSPNSAANIARVASPEVAELLSHAAITGDDLSRWDLLEQAHRAALTESLIVPIAASTAVLALGAEATGLSVRADGSLDLESTR